MFSSALIWPLANTGWHKSLYVMWQQASFRHAEAAISILLTVMSFYRAVWEIIEALARGLLVNLCFVCACWWMHGKKDTSAALDNWLMWLSETGGVSQTRGHVHTKDKCPLSHSTKNQIQYQVCVNLSDYPILWVDFVSASGHFKSA